MTIPTSSANTPTPSLLQASKVWGKIGMLSFGGPAAQIALMHQEIVEKRTWLTEAQFLNALGFCMLLPGPEAMQLATYAGWHKNGTLGGLIAGLLFVLPGAAVIMTLAIIYTIFGDVSFVKALFYGIKAAVLIVIIEALIRVARKALTQKQHWVIAALAFIGIFFFSLPYPLIVLAAGCIGWFSSHALLKDKTPPPLVPLLQTCKTILIWLTIWLAPLLTLSMLGAPEILTEVGLFFSKLATVTFGGAYAVLAYMAQDVVVHFGWLSASEMIDALGLAETTPGPLILVTQFVGYLAGERESGLWLGLCAALVTLWVTFAPCFLWIFAGAPYIEWVSSQPKLKGALNAITAAVVGVILNLSLWFALHVLFSNITRQTVGPITLWQPQLSSLNGVTLSLFALSCFLVFRLKWNIFHTMLLAATLGAGLHVAL